jgi:Family of unknown function (DUF6069)
MRATTHLPSQTSLDVSVRAGAIIAASAIVANLTVLGVATLAGADMVVRPSAGQPAIHISGLVVAITVLLPVLVGTVLLIPARRWGARGWPALAAVGLALSLVSVVMPLAVEAELSTRVALASMHALTGVTWFVVVRRAATRLPGV